MKVYSSDAHPLAQAVATMSHDVNQSMSYVRALRRNMESAKVDPKFLLQLEQLENKITGITTKCKNIFHDYPSEIQDIPKV